MTSLAFVANETMLAFLSTDGSSVIIGEYTQDLGESIHPKDYPNSVSLQWNTAALNNVGNPLGNCAGILRLKRADGDGDIVYGTTSTDTTAPCIWISNSMNAIVIGASMNNQRYRSADEAIIFIPDDLFISARMHPTVAGVYTRLGRLMNCKLWGGRPDYVIGEKVTINDEEYMIVAVITNTSHLAVKYE